MPVYNKPDLESNAQQGKTFQLDGRLKQDTLAVSQLDLCQVLRMDDQRYPWFILVPQVADVVEFLDLPQAQQALLARETAAIAALLKRQYPNHKLNCGALGNVVQQLHVHLVMRNANDPAWPGPVWGHSKAERFKAEELAAEIEQWRQLIAEIS